MIKVTTRINLPLCEDMCIDMCVDTCEDVCIAMFWREDLAPVCTVDVSWLSLWRVER